MVPLARARHLRIEYSGDVHFSPSRTSRTVVCRSTDRVGACRVVSANAADTRSPGRLNDVTLTVSGRNQSILTNVFASIQPQSRAAFTRRYGPSAVPGPGQLIAVRCSRTGQTSDYRSAMLLLWWFPSVNSYKFQLCNHKTPGTQKLWFPGSCPPSHLKNFSGSLAGIVYG